MTISPIPRRSQFRRSLRPTPEQLQSMGLKPGANELEFEVVSGGVQGATTVSCNLFLWSSNAKIVISDVDGTITKSDVLGHLMYMVGRDWTHEGVARLFTNIKVRGGVAPECASAGGGEADLHHALPTRRTATRCCT